MPPPTLGGEYILASPKIGGFRGHSKIYARGLINKKSQDCALAANQEKSTPLAGWSFDLDQSLCTLKDICQIILLDRRISSPHSG